MIVSCINYVLNCYLPSGNVIIRQHGDVIIHHMVM